MKWWASQFSVVMVEINLGPFQFSIVVVDFQLIFKEICQRRLERGEWRMERGEGGGERGEGKG